MNDMVCSSCQKPKAHLRPKKSNLMPQTTLLLCGTCFEKKCEPRWAIVFAAREYGVPTVADLIKNHRYVGEPITVKELT